MRVGYFFLIVKPRRVFPPLQTGQVGENIVFACFSFIKVRWTFQGGAMPINANISQLPGVWSYSLDIFYLTLENAGIYTCHGKDRNMLPFDSDGVLKIMGMYTDIKIFRYISTIISLPK